MNGSEKIQALLKADSTLVALLDTFTVGSYAYPAIFHSNTIPENFKERKYINYYRTVSLDNTLAYTDAIYTVNCRGESFPTAEAIQSAAVAALNRKNPLTGRGILTCSSLPVIPPQDERDDYNAPIEVRIKIEEA